MPQIRAERSYRSIPRSVAFPSTIVRHLSATAHILAAHHHPSGPHVELTTRSPSRTRAPRRARFLQTGHAAVNDQVCTRSGRRPRALLLTDALRERSASVPPGSAGTSEHTFEPLMLREHAVLQKFAPRLMSRGASLLPAKLAVTGMPGGRANRSASRLEDGAAQIVKINGRAGVDRTRSTPTAS